MQVQSPSSRVAGRLLQAAGRAPAEHTILRENVATLLEQLKPEFVAGLQDVSEERLLDSLNGTYANGPLHMALKLSRDIRQKPYSDRAVAERLEQLDRDLKASSAEIVRNSPGIPCKFYVMGSLLKGRFGANSDVDVLCEASPEWMKAHQFDHSDDVSFQYLDRDKEKVLAAFAPVREVTAEEIQQPGFLAGVYREGLERKGYTVTDGHLAAVRPDIQRPVETPPEAAKYIMWSLPMV